MPGSGATRLGPIARKLVSPDRWTDGYPGPPAYAKELDSLLKFADEHGCLARFVPNLEARDKQRDKALNELRLAYLLHHLGFPILRWDPAGANGKVGEFLLDSPEKVPIFAEVKSPGWESELSGSQIQAGRAQKPKYIGLEGGAIGNWQAVHRCIASPKTYPKFRSDQSSLLIMADDLRVPLHDTLFQVKEALYGERRFYGEDGYFTTDRFENIGGLGVFGSFSAVPSRGLEYEFVVFENPCALVATRLPGSMMKFKETFRCIVKGTER